MTVEIADIRAGIVTNLETLSDSAQITAYPKPSPTPPALMVIGFDEITRMAFGTHSFGIPFVVRGLAGLPIQEAAYIKLDKWLSPVGTINVWSAIESDKSLGGKVQDVVVLRCDGAQTIQVSTGVEMLGSTWHLMIEL